VRIRTPEGPGSAAMDTNTGWNMPSAQLYCTVEGYLHVCGRGKGTAAAQKRGDCGCGVGDGGRGGGADVGAPWHTLPVGPSSKVPSTRTQRWGPLPCRTPRCETLACRAPWGSQNRTQSGVSRCTTPICSRASLEPQRHNSPRPAPGRCTTLVPKAAVPPASMGTRGGAMHQGRSTIGHTHTPSLGYAKTHAHTQELPTPASSAPLPSGASSLPHR
jgi:hypothetical protein